MRRFLAGAGQILANKIFFMPRRQVEITIRRVDRSELPPLTREQLNPWLEQWYNEGGYQPPVFVPYHFLFGPRTHEYPEVHVGGEVDLERIKPETIEAVGQILADRLQRPPSDKEQTAHPSLAAIGLASNDPLEGALQ